MQRETVRRGLRGLLFAGAMLSWAAPAHAICTNDTDCPTTACGGQVCQWTTTGHNCVAAGTDPQGSDGWCTTTADCKCMGEGATCGVDHCTFTLSPDGGAAGAVPTDAGTTASSSGGYASSSGATGSSGSSSGATTSGGGSSSGETLPDANIPSGSTTSGNSGGCSVTAATTGAGSAPGFALACLGLVGVVRRRRHHPQAAARG